ncbi:hypothetical protein ABK040_009346 [Willaertia magna]
MQTHPQPNTYTKEQFLTFYRMISPSIQEPPEHLKQFSLILSNKLLQPINETNLHLFDSDYNINPDISYPVPSTRGRGRGGRGGRRGGSITTVGRGSSSSLPFSTVGRGRGTSIGGVKSPLGSKLPAWALDEEENNNTNPLSNNNSTPPTTDDDTFGSGSKFEPVSLESLSAATLKMNESWKHLKQPSKDVSSNEALENLDLTWDSQWYYLTEENNEPKGPYSLSKLKEWLDFSYFQPDTRITQDVEAEDVFIIGDVIKKLQQQEEKNDNVTSDEIETSLTPNNNLTTLVVEEKKDDVNNFLTEKEITRSGLLSSVLSDVINEDQIKPTSSLLGSSSLVGNEKTPVTLPPTLNQPTTPTLQPQQPSIGFGGAWGYNQPMNHMVDNLPHHAFMNPQLPYSNIPPQHMGHHSFLPYPQNTHWMTGFGNMHSPQMPSVTEIESQFQNMLHQQHLMMSQANSQILQQQHMQHQQHLQQQQPILQQPPLQQQTNIIPTATSPTAISPSVTPKVHDVNEITSLPPIVPVILNSEEESNLNIVENDISPKEIGESLEDKFEKSANKNKQTSKKKKEEKQTNQTKQKSSEKKQTKPKVETKVEPILTVKTEPVFRSLPPSESINFSNDVKEEKGWGSSIVVTKPTVPTLKEIMEEQKKEQENKKQQAEHKKKLEVEQAKKELQQQIQQQPLLGKTGWGATPITVQSNLKEIIEEETKKKKQSEQKKTVQQNQASVVKQSIWGAGSLPSSNTKESNTKFKSVPAPQGTTTTTFVSTPTKAVDKNQLNFQGIKAAPTVNPTTVKEEEDQEEMFWDTTPTTTNTANTTPKNEQKKSSKKKKNKGGNTATTQQSTEKKDEFPALSVPSNGKSNPFGQSDDVSQDFKEWFKKSVKKFKPVDNSFMYFLLSLNSEKEVVEYITEYLGDSAPVQKFAQEFIANKSFEGFKDVKKKK